MIRQMLTRKVFAQGTESGKSERLRDDIVRRAHTRYPGVRKEWLTLVLSICFHLAVSAQTDTLIGRFSAYENDGVVYLDWSIRSGSTCDGIRIYRSSDSLEFFQIGEISGVCGNTSFEQSYDFTDTHPIINTKSYYRLELGNVGFTSPVSIEVYDIEYSEYLIGPNPCDREVSIRFSNESAREHRVIIHDAYGRLVSDLLTREGFLHLDVSLLPAGIYVFGISENGKEMRVQGRMVVQHP